MNNPAETPYPTEVVRLPLWKECAKDMIANGLEYGKTYKAEYFTDWLKCDPESIEFGIGISEIRRCLEHEGFYLSGRGQKGEQYILLAAEANSDVMRCYARKATDALRRGVILGTNTRLDQLAANDRRRHEAILEKMATKLALVSRSGQVARALKGSGKLKLLD